MKTINVNIAPVNPQPQDQYPKYKANYVFMIS